MNANDPSATSSDSIEAPDPLREEHLRELGMMLVGIAHELNTPLGVVISTVDGLQRCRQKLREVIDRPALGPDDHEQLRAILEHMESGGPVLAAGMQRMEALVRELRLQGRSGDQATTARVSLTDLIEGNLLLLQFQLKQGIAVDRRFEAEPMVEGHAVFLGQVLLNIIRNAIQAMDGQGTLTLTVRERGGMAEVQVSDTGHGIADDVLARLFCSNVTTKCPDEGTGIGLLHCKKIIDRHGGTIAAANGPDGGAVFTVTLPVA